MDTEGFRKLIKGLIAAPVTPFDDEFRVDLGVLKESVEFLLSKGVDMIIPCGSIGEFPSLSSDERKRVLEAVLRTVQGRVPVVANVSSTNGSAIVDFSEHAERVGASGVMVLPPYYFRCSAVELVRFFERLDSRINLPFLIYNNPSTAGVDLPMDSLDRLAGLEWFAGLKEANPDPVRFRRIVRRFGDAFPVVAANETSIGFFLLSGAKAVMTAAVDFAPELMRAILDSAIAYDQRRTFELYDRLLAFRELMMPALREGYPAYIPFTRSGMELRGIRVGPPRPPLSPLDPAMRAAFHDAVRANALKRW